MTNDEQTPSPPDWSQLFDRLQLKLAEAGISVEPARPPAKRQPDPSRSSFSPTNSRYGRAQFKVPLSCRAEAVELLRLEVGPDFQVQIFPQPGMGGISA